MCQTLTSLDPTLILEPGGGGLNAVAMRSLLQARDCLLKYVEREMEDAWALNLLGLFYEQEGLLAEAERAFYKYVDLPFSRLEVQYLLILFFYT